MIITKTPFRMSFFGGGTDMESFFTEYGGAVLSTTFDKYCYVNVRHLPRFFNYRSKITYSKIEQVNPTAEIQHPAVREAMKFLDVHDLIMSYDADLPARTGLGTSSSFAVGMLAAFHALKGEYASKKILAKEAIYLERVLCQESGGWQDQIAASFGGLNVITFSADGFYIRPVIIAPQKKKELNDNLLLFFTGISRLSSEIQKETVKGIRDKTKQLIEMKDLVYEAEKILTEKNNNLDEFGRILDWSWKLKRQTGSKISTETIDGLYERAIAAGALGGKLLGAGGGGFLLFYVPLEKQSSLRFALKDLLEIPFQFETTGTEVIYYEPENHLSNE